MARKFEKTEIDLIYEQLRPEEEVLWRGKPKLTPNLSFMTTLFLAFLSIILVIILRILKLNNQFDLMIIFKDWFNVILFIFALVIIISSILYAKRYHIKIKNTFYVISTTRLVIFDSKKQKIFLSKLFSTVKILRLKKTVFDPGSIIFDIEIIDERIKEIGFINIYNAEDVMDIISHQLYHTRNK